MQTPVKLNRSRRAVTTAHTEQGASTRLISSKYNQRTSNFIGEDSFDLNKRLQFQGLAQSRLYREMPSKGGNRMQTSQVEYRNQMLNYLNSVFQSVYLPQQTVKRPKQSTQHNNKQQLSPPDQSTQIKLLLGSFMDAVRQLRVHQMSQYNLAMLLKHTHFINSILYERDTVTYLWNQLREPSIPQLFVFMCVLYFHLGKRTLNNQQQLLTYIGTQFGELGYKCSALDLEAALERSRSALKQKLQTKLLNNRTNRHTASSLNRHKQR